MRVMLDLDGVFANFPRGFNLVAMRLYPEAGIQEDTLPLDYDYDDFLTAGEFRTVLSHLWQIPNFWETLQPIPGAIKALDMLDWSAHDLYFCTSRHQTVGKLVAVQTRNWIRANLDIDYRDFSVIVCGSTPNAKVHAAKAIGADVSLDDYFSNVKRLSAVPNHYAYLLDAPYNRLNAARDYEDMRVKSVQEFLEKTGLSLV